MATYTPEQEAQSRALLAKGEELLARAKQTPAAPPATPTSQASPAAPSGEYFPRYTSGGTSGQTTDFQPPAVRSESDIYAEKARAAQGEIDALNRLYEQRLQEQDVINQGRNRQTSSVNTLTGMAGSTEANVQVGKTDTVNKRENDLIRAEQSAAIANIFAKVKSDATQTYQFERQEARMDAESAMKARAMRQEEAAKNLTMLAQSGVTLEGLRQSDPKSYEYFASQVGGEQVMQAMMTLNRPQDAILDKKMEGGKYIISYQNPLTGKIRIETVDLGLPPEYDKSIDAGDRILFMPSNWDGDTSKLIAINKGLTPSQQQSSRASSPGQIVDANGKPIKLTATQVDTITGFDSTVRSATDALNILSQGVKTGPIAGSVLQGNKLRDAADPNQMKLEQTLAQIKASYMKALSGAAVSEQEVKRLAKFLPDIYDQEGVIKSKLETLMSDSAAKKSGFLSTLGAAGSSAQTIIAPDGTEVQIVD